MLPVRLRVCVCVWLDDSVFEGLGCCEDVPEPVGDAVEAELLVRDWLGDAA